MIFLPPDTIPRYRIPECHGLCNSTILVGITKSSGSCYYTNCCPGDVLLQRYIYHSPLHFQESWHTHWVTRHILSLMKHVWTHVHGHIELQVRTGCSQGLMPTSDTSPCLQSSVMALTSQNQGYGSQDHSGQKGPPSFYRLGQELKTQCFIQTRVRWKVSGTGSQQPFFN